MDPDSTPSEFTQELEAVASIVAAAAWPLVALIITSAFALSHRLRRLVSQLPVRRLKLGAAEVELTEESAKERRLDLEAYRNAVDLDIQLRVDALNIRQQVRDLIESPIQSFFQLNVGQRLEDYRATVHIPDRVLEDSYYQLIDYLPKAPGARRVRSQRFGVVGLAFRLEESITRWTASQQVSEAAGSSRDNTAGGTNKTVRELIERWGMTKDEAEDAAAIDRFYMAATLRHRGIIVGVLYLDAKTTAVFQEYEERKGWTTFHARLRTCTDETGGLSEALYSIVTETGEKTALLPIYSR